MQWQQFVRNITYLCLYRFHDYFLLFLQMGIDEDAQEGMLVRLLLYSSKNPHFFNCIFLPYCLNNTGLKNSLFQHFTQLRPFSYIAKYKLTNYNYYLFCLKHQTLYISKALCISEVLYIPEIRSSEPSLHSRNKFSKLIKRCCQTVCPAMFFCQLKNVEKRLQ